MTIVRRGYVALALSFVFLVAWMVWEFRPSSPIDVITAAVSRGPISRRIVTTGTLQAMTTVDVGAQESGNIQSLRADFNSVVHAGDVIATLEPSLYQAGLTEAEAALARAQAAETQAEADATGLEVSADDARTKLTRAQTLAASELIPQADLDAARSAMSEAETDYEGAESKIGVAKASVTEARAAVAQATIDLERTVIRSPIDGIVVARRVDVGQTVAATVQAPVLFTIAADLKELQLNVDVDESDVGSVQNGSRVTFAVDSYPNREFQGTVSQIRVQPASANTVVTYTTVVNVFNSDERLRPGMTATVVLEGPGHDNAIRIPNSALAFRPSLDVLMVLGQPLYESARYGLNEDPAVRRVWRFDGRVLTPIDVRVGLADGQWTELVIGPLGPGDPLVTRAEPR